MNTNVPIFLFVKSPAAENIIGASWALNIHIITFMETFDNNAAMMLFNKYLQLL